MLQRMMIFAFAFFMVSGSYVSAHSVIESSIPADGEEINSPVTSIEIKFNTKIEDVLRVTAENEAGEVLEPGIISLTDETLMGTFEKHVENGFYTVTSEVIGSDGHKIEGQFSFEVKVQDMENEESSSNEPANQKGKPSDLEQKEAQNRETSNNNLASPAMDIRSLRTFIF